jgi:uncharacterized protein DUF6515
MRKSLRLLALVTMYIAAVLAIALILDPNADAQSHGEAHVYPAPGFAVEALPPDHLVVNGREGRYYFHQGVWYRQSGSEFVVVRPPLDLVVPILPTDYTTVWAGSIQYYYANHTYYVAVPQGYAVAPPPPASD